MIRGTLLTSIKTFLQFAEEKHIIFSNISLLRLGKNMSIAMQNMTESKKNHLTN